MSDRSHRCLQGEGGSGPHLAGVKLRSQLCRARNRRWIRLLVRYTLSRPSRCLLVSHLCPVSLPPHLFYPTLSLSLLVSPYAPPLPPPPKSATLIILHSPLRFLMANHHPNFPEGPPFSAFGFSFRNAPPLFLRDFPISIVEDGVKDSPTAELEDKALWKKFYSFVNEMIITESGRRIFPALRVKLSGLDKKANYYVIMEIAPCDANRWKFHNSRWTVAGKAEPEGIKPFHIHPDSPASGEHWMNRGASFHRVKVVTNNGTNNRTDCTALNAMHKYQSHIHIVRSDDIYSLKVGVGSWARWSFPETEFIAVTAYQNNLLTTGEGESGGRHADEEEEGEEKEEEQGEEEEEEKEEEGEEKEEEKGEEEEEEAEEEGEEKEEEEGEEEEEEEDMGWIII